MSATQPLGSPQPHACVPDRWRRLRRLVLRGQLLQQWQWLRPRVLLLHDQSLVMRRQQQQQRQRRWWKRPRMQPTKALARLEPKRQ